MLIINLFPELIRGEFCFFMANIQEIFNRIQKSKKEQKDIKAMYKDALASSKAYEQAGEELKRLKDKKKQIEEGVKDDFRSEFDKLEVLKAEIENDNMLLSDAVMSAYIKGQNVEIKDDKDNRYEPIFSVRYKKAG